MARNRRKIDRAQHTAELRERSGRFLRALMTLASLGAAGTAILYAGTACHRWLTTSPTFAIRSISLDGNRRASASELVRLSGLVPGKNIFTADLDAAAAGIAAEPWIVSVSVHRSLPGAIHIAVTERKPALLVDLGKLYFADPEGVVFKRARAGDDLDLPVVTGLDRQAFAEHRERVEARLREVLAFMSAYKERHLDARAALQELNLDADDGLDVFVGDAKAGQQAVLLGEPPYEVKLNRLGTLWDELEKRGAHAQVIHLDNRARPGWVAVKLALGDPAPVAKPH